MRPTFSFIFWMLAVSTAALRGQTAYNFTTFAGQNTPPGYADGIGSVARFSQPLGVAIDANGNIFVADAGNLVIRKITPAGVVSTFAGRAGEPGRTDGADARFSSPSQLTFDRDGNLLVTESNYYGLIRKITPAGVVSTVAGGNSTGQDGPVSFAGFERPQGIAVDAAGTIFVADTDNNTIRKILSAGVVSTLAGASVGAGTVDITDGPGDVARFNRPTGMAIDAAGNLFIADAGNNTIRQITLAGVVSTYAGVPRTVGSIDGARAVALFSSPTALAFDIAGNLYVADSGNHLIRKIATGTGAVSTLAGLAGVYGGDDGTGSAARFNAPSGLAVDLAGNLIVADTGNNTVRRITPAGIVTTLAGRATIGSTDGTTDAARFLRPENIASDPAGNLFVTDPFAHTVRKVTPAGVVTTIGGKAGYADNVDGPSALSRFHSPGAITLDADGNAYIADVDNGTVRKISPTGLVTTIKGRTEADPGNLNPVRFPRPSGVAVDGSGNLFVADSSTHAIRKITPTGTVTTLAGSGTYGHVDGVGTAASFNFPSSLVIDRSGTLFVLENGSIIRRVTVDGTVTTYAGRPFDRGSEDGPLSQAKFTAIDGLALDAAGNIFLTDNCTIREITAQGRVVTLGGRIGSYGLADGVGGFARFWAPGGIAVDAAGNLYIADAANALIRKGTPTPTAVAPPIITNPTGSIDESRKAVAGDTVTFRVTAAGSEPLAYQWFKNGVALAGETRAELTLTNITAAAEGAYSATVANSAGLETQRAVSLSVYTPALNSFTTRHVRSGGAFLWSIAAGNGRLVAVGTEGTILASADGRTWTTQNSGTTDWLVGVTFGANQFVAVGDRGRVLTSTDGLAWTNVSQSATTQRLNNIVYGAGQFVAVGEGGAIVTSPDARTWTARASGVSTWLRGLAYNAAENYFAVSGQNGVFRTSPDAIVWSNDPRVDVAGDLEATVAVNSHATFVSIGQDGLAVRTQRSYFTEWFQPGVRYYSWYWSYASAATNVRLRGIAQAANAIFATGENGVILAAPDISGPWARLASGTNANLVGGFYVGNTLYVVGENETILQSDPLYGSRLIDISTRGQVGAGNPMISGFVIAGATPKQVLIRAAGPALAGFGLAGTLAAPQLTLFDGAQHPLASNTGWSSSPDAAAISAAATRVGAFPFATNSADAAILVTLPPGAYTAQVGANGGSGLSLVEAYDADPLASEGSRAINISTRGFTGTGANKLIAGFVVGGTASRRVLIRTVGPSLAPFGVSGVLAQPLLQLYNSRGTLEQTAGAWSTQINAGEIRTAAPIAGAFTLAENSADAALVTTLAPGSWTVQVSGVNNTTGTVLLEVYDLP